MFLHILRKIKILEDGFSNIMSEAVLIGDIKNKSSLGNPRTDTEAVKIIRVALSRPKKYRGVLIPDRFTPFSRMKPPL